MKQRGAASELADVEREFTDHFRELVAGLGNAPGWYGALARRDPEAVSAYEAGVEPAPWDVVHAVLHDLAALRGVPVDPADVGRAQRLYRAAVAGRDAAPGSGTALRSRLDAMLRERHDAVLRERAAAYAVDEHAGTGGDPRSVTAGRLANALAWARDDRERAGARCAELQARLDAVEARQAEESFADRATARRAPAPRGARFATTFDEGFAASDDAAPAPRPQDGPAAAGLPAGRAPRGARFAGAAAEQAPPPVADVPSDAGPRQERARVEAARLGALRRAGRGGEAYVVLCEAAAGPAAALPVLARELERAGLAADVATLLWEVAVLPPDRLAAAAAALARADRTDDCRTLLRQAAARPAAEVAALAGALYEEGGGAEAATLLAAVAGTRQPEEAAAVAREHPGLAAPLLEAAAAISRPRRRDVAAALRRAGLPDR
ncbi:hypothetical protein [Streptomyces sp. SPB162]|uniref:hypothetical protein n=1 Tax=Streptomyces sp. SPB162 TaxID=2940560 RepID=UPI0024063C28|nr:hypothetical protein [Streptomyces sp. SPB162]MDF9816453.1 hypothetical protein [Streptomyces sp. SPB162]